MKQLKTFTLRNGAVVPEASDTNTEVALAIYNPVRKQSLVITWDNDPWTVDFAEEDLLGAVIANPGPSGEDGAIDSRTASWDNMGIEVPPFEEISDAMGHMYSRDDDEEHEEELNALNDLPDEKLYEHNKGVADAYKYHVYEVEEGQYGYKLLALAYDELECRHPLGFYVLERDFYKKTAKHRYDKFGNKLLRKTLRGIEDTFIYRVKGEDHNRTATCECMTHWAIFHMLSKLDLVEPEKEQGYEALTEEGWEALLLTYAREHDEIIINNEFSSVEVCLVNRWGIIVAREERDQYPYQYDPDRQTIIDLVRGDYISVQDMIDSTDEVVDFDMDEWLPFLNDAVYYNPYNGVEIKPRGKLA